MAKIDKMPHTNIISGLKGTVDFYYWKGVACARMWPRSPGKQRAPAVKAQWPAFSAASKLWVRMTPRMQASYAPWTGHARQNARDLQIKCYIGNVYKLPLP